MQHTEDFEERKKDARFVELLGRIRSLEADQIEQQPQLPLRQVDQIFQLALEQGTLEDQDWVHGQWLEHLKGYLEHLKSIAERDGYFPFINLRRRAHRWILKNCDQWVLDIMADALENPHLIYPAWGVQFAATMYEIGEEKCREMSESQCLYEYVVNHPYWQGKSHVRKFLKSKPYGGVRKPRQGQQAVQPASPKGDTEENSIEAEDNEASDAGDQPPFASDESKTLT